MTTLAVTSVAATTVAATPSRPEIVSSTPVPARIATRSAPPIAASTPVTNESATASTGPEGRPLGPPERLPLVLTDGLGIPESVRLAYESAAEQTTVDDPGCGLTWQLLAGVGRVESGHASGGRVDDTGTTRGRIVGVRLDGTLAGVATITDTDGGELDGDTAFDRAVGPMQFLPATWSRYRADGNSDGVSDPDNVHDAALAAARLLCSGGGDLSVPADVGAALFRYNLSAPYGLEVQAWAQAYRTGGAPVIPPRSGPGPEPAPPAAPPRPSTDPAVRPEGTPETGAPPATSDIGTPDPAAPPSTAPPAQACAPVVLMAAVTVLPDGRGLLLRLPLDGLPQDCDITDATLRADPAAGDAADTAQLELIVGPWPDDTTEVPETAGGPILAEDDENGPFWPLGAIVGDLVGNPDGGLLLSDPDDGESLSWPGDEFRLDLVLGS